jgi:hypothetical protein
MFNSFPWERLFVPLTTTTLDIDFFSFLDHLI